MGQESAWLSISVFCARDNWHIVLKNAIQPFLKLKSVHIHAYYLGFDYMSGENVQLALLCRNEYKEVLAATADAHFQKFLSFAGFESRVIKYPVNGIFMPFPSNTIQYGLFGLSEGHDVISETVSAAILEVLGGAVISDESLLTFAFYLLAAGKQQIAPSHCSLIDAGSLDNSYIPLSKEVIHKQYLETKEMLKEIYEDVQSTVDSPSWLLNWKTACGVKSKQKVTTNKSEIYNDIANAVFNQLGFDKNVRILLLYFINNTTYDSGLASTAFDSLSS